VIADWNVKNVKNVEGKRGIKISCLKNAFLFCPF
jgi:hypothetical protein